MPQLPLDSLLYDKAPLVINPVIAEKVGLNEAIILHQVQYWQDHNEKKQQNLKEGHYWTYNSYEQWQGQFPWWSTDTIKRTITRLEKEKLLISGNYNTMKLDRTKWYRVNFDHPLLRRAPTMGAKCPDHEGKLPPPIPETNTETTTTVTNVGDAEAPRPQNLPKKKREPNPDGSYGNPDVAALKSYFKERLGLAGLDDKPAEVNRTAWNLLRKKVEGDDRPALVRLKEMIDAAAEDSFWQGKLTSLYTFSSRFNYFQGLVKKQAQRPQPQQRDDLPPSTFDAVYDKYLEEQALYAQYGLVWDAQEGKHVSEKR